MPTDTENIATARAATCGAATGYPSTLHTNMVNRCSALRAALTSLGAAVPAPPTNAAGPHWAVVKPSDDVAQQTASRFAAFGTSMSVRDLLAYLTVLTDAVTASTASPSPIASDAQLVGVFDYSTGDLDQWATLQTRDRNGDPGTYSTYSAAVRNGGPGHETAARFEVRSGDVPNFGGGERSEVRAPGSQDVSEGDERYYEFSLRFGDTAYTPPRNGWNIVMQWHAGEGSPPLCLECNGAGQLAINNNRSGGYSRAVCPIDAGKWHDYVLRVKFSGDPNVGMVEMWRDGQKLISFKAATMASASSYLKMGLYRNREGTQVVWNDGLRIYAA